MSDLSLFDIERGLHDLMTAWQEAATPEAVAAAEQAIQAYAEAEVRKVDGIRRYLRACSDQAVAAKSEAQVQATRAKAWEARGARLKQFCFDVMKSFGVTKLEGQTGSLRIQPNGGKQPVVVSDEALVPREFINVTITATLADWDAIGVVPDPRLPRVPSLALIAAELEKPCEKCSGNKSVSVVDTWSPGHTEDVQCSACGGSGKRGVPGCSLAPRGEHVRVS